MTAVAAQSVAVATTNFVSFLSIYFKPDISPRPAAIVCRVSVRGIRHFESEDRDV